MSLPEFESIESRATACGSGRLYGVAGSIELLAYELPDPRGRRAGVLYIYAFVDGDRFGYWNHTTDPDDLRRVITAYRAIIRGEASETLRAPAGEFPTIVPTFDRSRVGQLEPKQPQERLEIPRLFGL